MNKEKDAKDIIIRQATFDDIPQILEVEQKAWGEAAATKEMFEARLETFSEGVLVAVLEKQIVGVTCFERLNYDPEHPIPTWQEATDNGFIRKSHNPYGESGYGVDLSVSPEFSNQGIGKMLVKAGQEAAKKLGLKQGFMGSRMPGFCRVANKISPEDYIFTDIDPELRFYKNCGFRILRLLPNYFLDPESLNFGVLMVWTPEK